MLYFSTTQPKALLDAFGAAIAKKTISTWEGSGDGPYGHRSSQWAHKALGYAKVESGLLRFTFVCVVANVPVKSDRQAVYAFYQAHLVETFTNHFPGMFTSSTLSSAPTPADREF